MIIIIGGGISGLAAAYELSQRRIPFRLLEATARLGGLIRTERRHGFTIDAGADSFLMSKPSARDLCVEMGLAPLVQEMKTPRSAYVLTDGRLYPLPSPSVLGIPTTLAAALEFNLLPLSARLRVLMEPFVSAGSKADESIASYFRRRFGPATVNVLAQPLLGGIHAGDVERLSVRSLFPNLVAAEAEGGVLRTLKPHSADSRGPFTSLSGGMETLPRAIAQALPAGAVQCSAQVVMIESTDQGWVVHSSAGREIASAILFATPLPVTAALLHVIEPRAAALFEGVPHASTVSVTLVWTRDEVASPLQGTGFVVARGEDSFRVTASTWVTSKWEGRAPPGYVMLRAFIGGVHDPSAVALTDEELVAIATRDLGRVLGITAPPELARVYRWHDASPQLEVGHYVRVRRIHEELETLPGIFVTGRGLRAVGIPDCISDARQVASAAADYVARSVGNGMGNVHARG
jgi:oxygen-dependent protoporphyrinogen oxidase